MGIASAVAAVWLGLMLLGVFLMVGCAALGLLGRSRIAAVAGLLLALITAYLFEPWTAFSFEPSNNPDFQALEAAFVWQAWCWMFVVMAVVAGAVRAFWRRRAVADNVQSEADALLPAATAVR